MSDLSERDRVQALLDAGRITQTEADILFAALEESETQETPSPEAVQTPEAIQDPAAQAASQPIKRPEAPRDAAPPTPPAPIDATPPIPPQPPEPARHPDAAAAEAPTTWVKLSGFCGDLSVSSDAGLSAPMVTGNATLERSETGYLIRTPSELQKGSRNWLTRLHQAAGDVAVRLPAGTGLELGIAAGDGEIRNVRKLKGSFTGGDLEVRGAETVDLTVTAGDVTLELRPRSGDQRLKATSGDVDVIFLPGTSATVSGSATCGDLKLPPHFRHDGGVVNQHFEGTLGAGEARLEVRLVAGDVTVKDATVREENA